MFEFLRRQDPATTATASNNGEAGSLGFWAVICRHITIAFRTGPRAQTGSDEPATQNSTPVVTERSDPVATITSDGSCEQEEVVPLLAVEAVASSPASSQEEEEGSHSSSPILDEFPQFTMEEFPSTQDEPSASESNMENEVLLQVPTSPPRIPARSRSPSSTRVYLPAMEESIHQKYVRKIRYVLPQYILDMTRDGPNGHLDTTTVPATMIGGPDVMTLLDLTALYQLAEEWSTLPNYRQDWHGIEHLLMASAIDPLRLLPVNYSKINDYIRGIDEEDAETASIHSTKSIPFDRLWKKKQRRDQRAERQERRKNRTRFDGDESTDDDIATDDTDTDNDTDTSNNSSLPSNFSTEADQDDTCPVEEEDDLDYAPGAYDDELYSGEGRPPWLDDSDDDSNMYESDGDDSDTATIKIPTEPREVEVGPLPEGRQWKFDHIFTRSFNANTEAWTLYCLYEMAKEASKLAKKKAYKATYPTHGTARVIESIFTRVGLYLTEKPTTTAVSPDDADAEQATVLAKVVYELLDRSPLERKKMPTHSYSPYQTKAAHAQSQSLALLELFRYARTGRNTNVISILHTTTTRHRFLVEDVSQISKIGDEVGAKWAGFLDAYRMILQIEGLVVDPDRDWNVPTVPPNNSNELEWEDISTQPLYDPKTGEGIANMQVPVALAEYARYILALAALGNEEQLTEARKWLFVMVSLCQHTRRYLVTIMAIIATKLDVITKGRPSPGNEYSWCQAFQRVVKELLRVHLQPNTRADVTDYLGQIAPDVYQFQLSVPPYATAYTPSLLPELARSQTLWLKYMETNKALVGSKFVPIMAIENAQQVDKLEEFIRKLVTAFHHRHEQVTGNSRKVLKPIRRVKDENQEQEENVPQTEQAEGQEPLNQEAGPEHAAPASQATQQGKENTNTTTS